MREDPPRYFILEDERDRFINIEYDYIYFGCIFDVNIERYVLISGFNYLFPDDAEKMYDLVGSKEFETSEQALEYVRNMLIGNGFKIVNKELLVYA